MNEFLLNVETALRAVESGSSDVEDTFAKFGGNDLAAMRQKAERSLQFVANLRSDGKAASIPDAVYFPSLRS